MAYPLAQPDYRAVKTYHEGKPVYVSQPEQEPVAWLELLREARDNCKASIAEEGISASRKEYRLDLEARLTAALNTSPPKRPWVGLTDEETKEQIKRSDLLDMFEHIGWYSAPRKGFDKNAILLIQAIEAKLKELNT